MIGKIVLGESLKSLIGELKLSYKRISTIIGDSLAAMRSGLR
ncbi:chromosome partitioning protein ParB [Alloprevotella tannerae]|nr:chromosome partitioning protein ParB [Alloprevotella tannerae]